MVIVKALSTNHKSVFICNEEWQVYRTIWGHHYQLGIMHSTQKFMGKAIYLWRMNFREGTLIYVINIQIGIINLFSSKFLKRNNEIDQLEWKNPFLHSNLKKQWWFTKNRTKICFFTRISEKKQWFTRIAIKISFFHPNFWK